MSFLVANFVDESANRTFLDKHYVTKTHIGTKLKMSSKRILWKYQFEYIRQDRYKTFKLDKTGTIHAPNAVSWTTVAPCSRYRLHASQKYGLCCSCELAL